MDRISHYEIVRPLGRGGMGEVFEAIDLDLGRRVALKFVAPSQSGDPESLRRFEREARAAASLHHPRIATLFSFDRSGERPFLVMELLTGRTLRDRLAGGPPPVPEALGLVRDVAGALAFAHRNGVVHRDIKPENLMFDAEGSIKITDFGLARTAEASRLTATGATLGTAAYMAPELLGGGATPAPATAAAEGAPPNAPADVFALGVTLFEVLSGSTPFPGDGPLAVMYAIANHPPRALREACPEAPEAVERLVARMLEKSPGDRPSAFTVAEELGRVTGVPVTAPAPPAAWPERHATPVDSGQVTLAVGPSTSATTTPVPGRGRVAPGAWVALAIVLVSVITVALAVRGRGRESRAQAVRLNNEALDTLRAGSPAAARALLERALALAPGYGEARLNLATVLHRAGEDDRAAELYGRVIADGRREPALVAAAHYGLGEIDLEAGAWPSAIAHLADAARGDTARAEYPNNLAYALVKSGRSDEAIETLRQARARFPGEAALLKNAALAWLQAGRPDSASAAAGEAVRLRPDFAAAWALKARSEAELGEGAAALASLAVLRGLSPDSLTLAEAELAVRLATAGRRP